jgi:putative ABC transport system substrate-binding protein
MPNRSAYAEAAKVPLKVAIMVIGNHNIVTMKGLKAGLKDNGFIDGKNITYYTDVLYKDQKVLDQRIKKLMEFKPDLIFTTTTPVTAAMLKANKKSKIPIVFAPVNDPIFAGLIKSLKRPGGHITGVRLSRSSGKQIEWLLKFNPKIKNLFVPYNPKDKSSLKSFLVINDIVKIFKLNLIAREVYAHKDIDELFKTFPQNIDAVLLPRDGMLMTRIKDFVSYCNPKKIIVTGTRYEMASKGALFGFGFNGYEMGKQAARMASKILNGASPGDIPVETAEDYLSVNLKTAKDMDIKIDEKILRLAHKIIRK